MQAVLALDFHPTFSVVAAGSNDCTIKFFDYSKPSVRRSYRTINEVASVKTIKFHPSGDFMLVGTEQPTCKWMYSGRRGILELRIIIRGEGGEITWRLLYF